MSATGPDSEEEPEGFLYRGQKWRNRNKNFNGKKKPKNMTVSRPFYDEEPDIVFLGPEFDSRNICSKCHKLKRKDQKRIQKYCSDSQAKPEQVESPFLFFGNHRDIQSPEEQRNISNKIEAMDYQERNESGTHQNSTRSFLGFNFWKHGRTKGKLTTSSDKNKESAKQTKDGTHQNSTTRSFLGFNFWKHSHTKEKLTTSSDKAHSNKNIKSAKQTKDGTHQNSTTRSFLGFNFWKHGRTKGKLTASSDKAHSDKNKESAKQTKDGTHQNSTTRSFLGFNFWKHGRTKGKLTTSSDKAHSTKNNESAKQIKDGTHQNSTTRSFLGFNFWKHGRTKGKLTTSSDKAHSTKNKESAKQTKGGNHQNSTRSFLGFHFWKHSHTTRKTTTGKLTKSADKEHSNKTKESAKQTKNGTHQNSTIRSFLGFNFWKHGRTNGKLTTSSDKAHSNKNKESAKQTKGGSSQNGVKKSFLGFPFRKSNPTSTTKKTTTKMLITPIDKAHSNRNKELAKETKSNQKGRRYYLRIRSKNYKKTSTTIKPDVATCKHCCTTTKSKNQGKPFPNLNPNIEKLHRYMNKEVLKNTKLNNHGLLKRSLHKLSGLINISTTVHLKHTNRPKWFKSFLRRGFRQRDKTKKISQTVTAPANITSSTTLPTTLGIKENNSSRKYTSQCTINPVDKTNEYLITIDDDEEEFEESETRPWKDDDIFEEFPDSVNNEVIFECKDNGLQNNLKGKTVIEAAHLFTDIEQDECTSSLLNKMKFQSRKFAGMIGEYVTEKNPTDDEKIVIIDGEHPERSDENNKIFIETVESTSETDQNNQWFIEEAKTGLEKTTEGDVVIIDGEHPERSDENNKIFIETVESSSETDQNNQWFSEEAKTDVDKTTEGDVVIIDGEHPERSNENNKIFIETVESTSETDQNNQWFIEEAKTDVEKTTEGDVIIIDTNNPAKTNASSNNKIFIENIYIQSPLEMEECHKSNREKNETEPTTESDVIIIDSGKTDLSKVEGVNKDASFLYRTEKDIESETKITRSNDEDFIIVNSDTKEKSEDSSKKSILSEKSKSLKTDKSIKSQDGGNKGAAENNSDVLKLCNKRVKLLKEKLDQIPQHHLGNYKTSTDELKTCSNTKELMLSKLHKISIPNFRTVKGDIDALKTLLNDTKSLRHKSHNTSNPDLRLAITDDGEQNSNLSKTVFPQSEMVRHSFGSIPIDDNNNIMIINSRITPRTKTHKSYKNFFLDSSKGKAKKGSFSFLVKDKNLILMKNGNSLKINESNKIKFLGKLSSSLKIDKNKNHKSNKQNKSGKGIDTNRGNNFKTKILHILHIPEKNSMITTTNDYQKFIIINNAVTPRLDEFNGPHKVFLESMKKKERKKFKFPLKNQNSKNRFKKLKKKNKLKSKIQKKILPGIHLDNEHNSISKLNKSILHYKEPLKKVLKIKNSSLATEIIKVLTGVGIKNVTLGKNRQKKTKVKNITSSPVSEQVNKPKDIGLAGNTLKALKDIMKFVKVFLNLRSKNVTRKIENPSLLHKQKKKTEALDSVGVTSPIKEVLNNSKSKNQALEKKSNFNVHKNKNGSEYVGFLQNKTDAVGIISHKKEALNSSKSRNHSIKKTLDRQIMVPEDNAMENNDSHGPGNKSKTVDLLKIMNTTSKRVVLNVINKTIYGYNQSQANKSKNYLKDFVILLLQHFIGKMFVNIPKKPSNFTKVGVNLNNPEMKENPNDWVEEFHNVSYKMYYNPETLTDFYKDAPKEKSLSSVNLNPGGQLLNIAYKVENLLNALSSFENANKPDEAINNNINGPKSAYHNPKKRTGMSKAIHQLKEDIEELDDVLFHNKSEETIEFSLESNQSEPKSSSFEPAINESYDLSRDTRQISVSGVQKRGGQSCVDRYIPIWANPFTYHESAHCLRFSDLWYSVYRLKDPFIYHSVYFEVFEKNCKTYENSWKLSTGGDIVQIGTFHRKSIDEGPSIVFTYTPFSATNNKYFCFDPLLHQIMVPRIVPRAIIDKYPQVDEGPGRYLLVSPSGISHDGEDCDKAGVGYSAFASQPDRCNKPAGSCLLNQPLDFWQHDTDALAHNKSGNYFLDNFAAVEDSSVKVAEGKQFLTVGYSGHYTSVVEIEMRIDDNIVIRNESPALIHEVLIDSTCEHQTKITIKVTNAGYVSTAYRPKITNCPVNVPNIWYDNEGPLVYIAPFRVHVFRVTLYGTSRPSRFHCSVEIMNNRSETLAVRRIRIQKYDRCFCVWHCLCSCAASSQKFGCHPMSIDHYHAAGFVGSVPETDVLVSKQISKTHYRENFARAVVVAFYIYIILIFFGLIKAIYGSLCYRRLALMHLHMLCPRFYQSARLMPAVCPCRREVIRPNSACSVSSDGSEVADPQSKRPATVLMLEFFYNTICYVCIIGLYIFIALVKSMKCCIFLCIPERRKDRRTLYDTRSFESQFSDVIEEHERRGTLSTEEFFRKCEAIKNKHMPYMLRNRNKRTRKELLDEIREEFLDIYRNADIYPNTKPKQFPSYDKEMGANQSTFSAPHYLYAKKTKKSINVTEFQSVIANTVHKAEKTNPITKKGANQRNKEQYNVKAKKSVGTLKRSIFSTRSSYSLSNTLPENKISMLHLE
ncbi:unnamed protein product [Nezara viridula]|uniref:Generative cell specific-1/HAP2 domain-containing protein n=1 Tax=Nezara viridula TaxID=85310 RepID=A0A9P0EF60_NEZVI|nr:unnamed protein product [Nezara viridula]